MTRFIKITLEFAQAYPNANLGPKKEEIGFLMKALEKGIGKKGLKKV